MSIEFHSEPNIENVKLVLESGANIIDIAARIVSDFNPSSAKLIAQKIEEMLKESV